MSEQALPRKGLITRIAGIKMEIYWYNELHDFAISHTQAIKAIDGTEASLKEYLNSVFAQNVTGTPYIPEQLTLVSVSGYWLTQALKGNQKAQGLMFAFACDSLQDFACNTFEFAIAEGNSIDLRSEIAKVNCLSWSFRDEAEAETIR